ncbi:MAG: di-trans,poly-cis-decaprenylcistransferase, partial [Candidatus Dadabacteria bacterium]
MTREEDINSLQHIAIIMDGNGRWAKQRGLARIQGHKVGGERVKEVVRACRELGVRYLTLFTFSTENWGRPQHEVSTLMEMLNKSLKEELPTLLKNNIRLRCIGNKELLPKKVLKSLTSIESKTSHLKGMDLILALSYGGRDEIVRAVKRVIKAVKRGEVREEEINENNFKIFLDAPDVPDPDLLIRTSGEY